MVPGAYKDEVLLHLLLTNREGLVKDVVVRGCVGHNNHEMTDFSILG